MKNVLRTFTYVCIIFITKLYIIVVSVMIKANNISNELKGNNTIIVAADKLNTITIIDEHIRICRI